MRKDVILIVVSFLFFIPLNNYAGEKNKKKKLVTESSFSEENLQKRKSFQNDICIPAKLYMLSDVQNNVFVEPLMKRWRPYDDVVRFSGSARFQRCLQRVASIAEPEEGTTVNLSLINQNYFDTIKTVNSSVIVGKQGIGTDTVIVSIIGDSFTQGAFFKDALLVKGYVPKIKLIGLRDISGYPGQFDEGRGGWTLGKYFTVTFKKQDAYNGLFQPNSEIRYWGSTDFWKLANAIRLNPKAEWTFGDSYNAGRYGTRSLLFDEKSGYKVNPEKNDLMYDNAQESYVKFDGKQWLKADHSGFTWDVDYGKYLSMWKLKAPSVLAEFLGLNDFRGAKDPSAIDFTGWNTQAEKLAASYHKAVPGGKFVLMIPSSACGIPDNASGDFTTRQNACMWEHRRNIIEKFDRRESEHIYVVDAGIAIDNLNGTNFTTDSVYIKPYSGYKGTETIPVQKGNPHPYPNYPTMGISLAAFIQKYR